VIDYILTILRMRDVRPISRGFSNDQARTVEKALKLKGMCATHHCTYVSVCCAVRIGLALYTLVVRRECVSTDLRCTLSVAVAIVACQHCVTRAVAFSAALTSTTTCMLL
jgi:hypothetical protein